MENENLTMETSENKVPEVVNTDELITDFSFQYKMMQMNIRLDLDDNNYGFCIES